MNLSREVGENDPSKSENGHVRGPIPDDSVARPAGFEPAA